MRKVTQIIEWAYLATWSLCMADTSPVLNHIDVERVNRFRRKRIFEQRVGLIRIHLWPNQPKPPCYAVHVRIHR